VFPQLAQASLGAPPLVTPIRSPPHPLAFLNVRTGRARFTLCSINPRRGDVPAGGHHVGGLRMSRFVSLTACAFVVGVAVSAAAQPLDRDPAAYCLFGQRSLSLKNMTLTTPCNVGVNCARPSGNSSCGTLSIEDAQLDPNGSQVASDKLNANKPGARIWQLFTNNSFNTSNVDVLSPPVQAFTTPIIAGTCDAACNADPSAIKAFCNFPSPFPACDPTKLVIVNEDADCPPFDTAPGNDTCDLPPGTYGDIQVKNQATLDMTAGVYNVCSFAAGRQARIRGKGVEINVADSGFFRASNQTQIGSECGDFFVRVEGSGSVNFGRGLLVAATVCAPLAQVNLGHGNQLIGQFFGDEVFADRDNRLQFCGETGRCTCFDDFNPKTAPVGGIVTLTSECDLRVATRVLVCGIQATIGTQTQNSLTFTVPAGATGDCPIDVESPAGTFRHNQTLTIS
jgi:hypothetical protein